MKKITDKIRKSDAATAILSLMNSNLIVSFIGAAVSIIQAKFVTAEQLGYFRQFGIITNYLFFLHLGTYQAVERLYPLYVGKGDNAKAKRLVGVAEAWIFLVSVPTALIFLGLSVFSLVKGNWMAMLGWLAQAVAMFTTVYGGFIKATYRSGQDFKKMAKAQYLTPLHTVLSIPIYIISPYVGLFFKNINTLATTVVMYIKRPIRTKKNFNLSDFKEIIANGLPRFSSSYAITTGIEAIRATMVLRYLGQTALGYWSFTWTIYGLVRQIPQSVSAVYAPRVTQEYGRTGSYKQCLRLCKKPILVCALLVCVLIPAGVFGSLVLLPLVLPNYVNSAGILAAAMICILPSCILDLPWQIINSMNKPGTLNFVAFTDMLIQCIGMILALRLDNGIYSVVIGSVAGSLWRMLCIGMFFLKLCGEEKKSNG